MNTTRSSKTPSGALNNATIEIPGGMTVVTDSKGRKATAPEHFAAKWDQEFTDGMVAAAYRLDMVDRIMCRNYGITAIDA